jgi:hypothetical protein
VTSERFDYIVVGAGSTPAHPYDADSPDLQRRDMRPRHAAATCGRDMWPRASISIKLP